MSTIPLSSIDPTSEAEKIESYALEPIPGATDEAKLDAVVASAMEKIPSATDEEQPRTKRSLDDLISEGLSKHEAMQADKESFTKSKASRDELNDRYGSQGDLSTTIDQYIQWAARFRENPQEAGQRFAESYLSASPYALTPREPKEKPEAFIDGTGKRYNGKILDAIVESATDGNEQKEFVATAKQREALKAIFKGKTFAEALATIVQIDRDAS
jgi:hypothetical protein